MRLPTSSDELRGLRAARWIRESSARQRDKYGPDAQRRMQNAAIAELGLTDSGLAWDLAASGWSGPDSMDDPPATRTAEFAAMLAAAESRSYDVLLVGYASRFIRDLATALATRRRLHRAGVVIWIADDRILTSSPADWERFVDKAKAAEIYSADLSRNIRAGYRAKLETANDPGGRPPYGFRRNAAALIEPDPDRVPVVQRAFELAASGATDREVAAHLDLGLHTVRGILTSPLYLGRLRDDRPASWPAVVDPATWNRVAASRDRRSRRSPGRPETRRTYVLPMLECASCSRRLVGDKDRYRHLDVCDDFLAAAVQPKRPVRGQHRQIPGASYRREAYEDLVPAILERIRLRAVDVADTVALYRGASEPAPDRLALARIEQQRERAITRFRRDRDVRALEAAMARLDGEEREASMPVSRASLTPAEVRGYLESLQAWWEAVEDSDRRALAETLFERIQVAGASWWRIEPTPEAVAAGLAEAFGRDEVEMVGARGLVVTITISSPGVHAVVARKVG